MFDWIVNLVYYFINIQPIYSVTLFQLLSLYVQYFVFGLLVSIPIIPLCKKENVSMTVAQVIPCVLIEDGIFRAIPIMVIGGSAGMYAHIIWGLFHVPRNFVFVMISGILMLRLWLGGLWVEALFVHILHDILIISLINYNKGKTKDD